MTGGEKLLRARRVERALGALFEKTRVPVIALEASGAFVSANAAAVRQYGYPLETLVEMRIHDLQATPRPIDADLARSFAGSDAPLDRRAHRRRDGSVLWVVPTAGPVEVDGEVLLVSVLTDVTQTVSAEEQAAAAKRHEERLVEEERALRSQLVAVDRLATIGRLAAGVAHEVNNPAGFVTLALQHMKDKIAHKKARPEDIVPMLDDAIVAMLQINQIMRDLTGFARERARTPIDLAMAANSAIRIAAHETKERATVDRVQSEGVVASVHGARIAQVVLNLVTNAAQAIPPGRPEEHRIDVRVYKSGDSACIDVVDTGSGVPAGLGDRIFEPFFTTREGSGGTGLGLWLSRAIIEEEGGTLTYESSPGGGTRFSIALPAHRYDDKAYEGAATSAEAAAGS